MNRTLRQVLSITTFLVATLGLAACQSTPPKAASHGTDASTLTQIAAKQQQQDQLLKEWQSLKPGLERLLVIEEELNLLLGQLEALSANLETSQSSQTAQHERPAPQAAPQPRIEPSPAIQAAPTPAPKVERQIVEQLIEAPNGTQNLVITTVSPDSIRPSEPAVKPVVIPTPASEPVSAVSQAGRFALQVASITERHRLPEIWQQLVSKHPRLISDLEPNYQQTSVRNTDYYRLKIGRFANRQEANSKCHDLQSVGMNCLVVDFTDSNFAQLVN